MTDSILDISNNLSFQASSVEKVKIDNTGAITAPSINCSPTISSGTTAPSSTPAKIGDIYIDTILKHTYVANGTSSSANWIKQNGSYCLTVTSNYISSPLDSVNYYAGFSNTSLTNTPAVRRMYIPKSGIITNVYGMFNNSGSPSNEAVSVYVRVNNTTDYLITNSLDFSTLVLPFENISLSIPVTKGDYIEFKIVTPAWATNPTALLFTGTALIDL